MYIYIYIYIHTNLPVSAIVRLLHPSIRDSKDQETFLAPSSADKQTRNYDIECSNHHPSLRTLRPNIYRRKSHCVKSVRIGSYSGPNAGT